jgi:hypothetical protein
VLPGSNESGGLLLSMTRVPPLALEGLTTLVTPALNAAAPALDVALPLPLLLPLPLQALMTRAARAPTAVAANILRLFMP